MVPVHDYEKRYAEAFVITKIRTFKHEPFFIVGGGDGGGGGGGLIRGTLRYLRVHFKLHRSYLMLLPANVSYILGRSMK